MKTTQQCFMQINRFVSICIHTRMFPATSHEYEPQKATNPPKWNALRAWAGGLPIMRNPFSYNLSTTTFFKKYEYVSKVFFVWRFSAMPIVAIPQIVGSAVFGYPRHYSPWWLSHLSLVCMMWQPNTKTRNGHGSLSQNHGSPSARGLSAGMSWQEDGNSMRPKKGTLGLPKSCLICSSNKVTAAVLTPADS